MHSKSFVGNNFGRIGGLVAGCCLLVACGGDDASDEPVVNDVTVRFSAAVNDTDFTCGTTYSGIGIGVNNEMRINDLRYFVHDLRLVRADASQQPLSLVQDGTWQLEGTALLDFEDGCAAGTPETNSRVQASVEGDPSEFTGICFKLGVPFEQNHISDATNLSPLNASGMLWSWTGGRKFVRIDGSGDPGNLNVAYNVHLGSTGCVDSAGDPAPDSACNFPNVAEVCIDNFNVATDTIRTDVGRLLAQKDITVSSGAPGCMSGNSDIDCIGLMERFGLDFTYSDGSNPPERHRAQSQAFFARQ